MHLQRATVHSTDRVDVEVPAIGNQPAYTINGNAGTTNTASVKKPPLLLLELQVGRIHWNGPLIDGSVGSILCICTEKYCNRQEAAPAAAAAAGAQDLLECG